MMKQQQIYFRCCDVQQNSQFFVSCQVMYYYLKYYGVFSVTCYVITGSHHTAKPEVEFIQLFLSQAIIFNTNVHHVAAIHYA